MSIYTYKKNNFAYIILHIAYIMEDNLENINLNDNLVKEYSTTVQQTVHTTVKTEIVQSTTTTEIITEKIESEKEKSESDKEKSDKEKSTFPPYLYVLSDNVGYVGSYYSISDIEEIVSAYYLITSFMVQCFKTSKHSDLLTVWVVLYKDIDAVAYVSNNRMDAVKVHSTLMQMGLAYMDCIDFWKQTVGLSIPAKERLDKIHTIQDKKLLDDIYNIFIQKLDLSTELIKNGPIEQLMNETQKITIMDAIVPTLIKHEEEIKEYNAIEECNAIDDDNACDEFNADSDSKDMKSSKCKELTSEEKEDLLEKKEKEVRLKIMEQNQKQVQFCEKCQILVDNLYNECVNTGSNNECVNTGSNNIPPEVFTQKLMLFIAQNCYLCTRAIRNDHRRPIQQQIEKKINYPIESPFISTSVDNKPKVDNDKLSEVMKNLSDLMSFKPEEEDAKSENK